MKFNVKLRLALAAVLFLTLSMPAMAQLNIGSAALPNANAMLQVTSSNKGFLLPQVALTGTNSPAPLSANVAGMLVYNTATAGSGATAVTPGFYANDGTKWNQITTQSSPAAATFTGGTLTCAGAQSGTYQAGVAMSASNTQVTTITVVSTGSYSTTTTTVNGVTFAASGNTPLSTGSQNFTLTASGTPLGGGTFAYPITFGGQTCSFNVTFASSATFACAGATKVMSPAGSLVNGTAYTGSYTIAYTAGNGMAYATASQTVNGLTLTRAAGTYAAGGGNVVYNLAGTAGAASAASFTIAECTSATFGCSNDISVGTGAIVQMMYDNTGSGTAAYSWCARTVVGPDGHTWLDRNLGAYQVATSSTDAQSYGSLYQWGRNTDGHQRAGAGRGVDNGASTTTATQASTNTPGSVGFITGSSDWRSGTDNNRWNNVTGTSPSIVQENNPCPSGYHVPTNAQQVTLSSGWSTTTSAADAYASTLRLPIPGYRNTDGSLGGIGSYANYWSATPYSTSAYNLAFNSGSINPSYNSYRSAGYSVRCIKN